MSNLFTRISEGKALDHTPTSAMTGGQLVQLAGKKSAITMQPIAADTLGSVQVGGLWNGPYVGGACNVGDNLWWDANGTPYGGSANGALTLIGADGDWWVGTVTKAPVAASSTVEFALNKENPTLPAWVGRARFKSAVGLSLAEATHSGGVMEITADAATVSLPAGVIGMEYIIVNQVADGGSLLIVDPDGTEIIRGANLTIANGETARNTKLTQIRGDYLHLICTVTATAWRCEAKRGIWAAV